MAVHGDGLARRKNLYEKGLVPDDWPSIRKTSGWQPPAALTEADAKVAFALVLDMGLVICGGRFCYACQADLADVGAPKSTSKKGIEAATGVSPTWTLAIPQGGHAPDCPVLYLLRWIGRGDSTLARLRTHDVADAAAQVLTQAKEPMELVGTDLDLLSEAERAARAEVLRGLGLTEEQLEEKS
jgi:hypothetical protein